MEREILVTGIGGQGVQLAGQVLARAATAEGRDVLTLGTYGGTMRGGSTEASVVIADGPVSTPPIVSRAWAGLGMHPRYWGGVAEKLRPDGIALVSELFEKIPDAPGTVLQIDTGKLAQEAGAPLAASLVLVGAFAATTELLPLSALVSAMEDSLPSYRRQHAEANARALEAGYSAVEAVRLHAWPDEHVGGAA